MSASNMVSPKTLKKNKYRLDKLLEKENKEDERHYKMLKKLIAKEAKSGSTSLYYNESYVFNDVISYRVKDRLRSEGFTITDDNIKYTVRNGFGNTWEEEAFGFWISWQNMETHMITTQQVDLVNKLAKQIRDIKHYTKRV